MENADVRAAKIEVRLREIDEYQRSPQARWASCGSLDALDDEREALLAELGQLLPEWYG